MQMRVKSLCFIPNFYVKLPIYAGTIDQMVNSALKDMDETSFFFINSSFFPFETEYTYNDLVAVGGEKFHKAVRREAYSYCKWHFPWPNNSCPQRR